MFDTNTSMAGIVDQVTGKKVKKIIEKYLNEPMSDLMLDNIMADIKKEFGDDHPAHVNLDDETNNIEIIVRDSRDRYIKCSSLTLFPLADK
jgi:hypothetical protein